MKSDAGVPVAYAMHAFPERFIPFSRAGSVAAGLPTARDTAGYRFAIADAGSTLNCATACCTNSPGGIYGRSSIRSASRHCVSTIVENLIIIRFSQNPVLP